MSHCLNNLFNISPRKIIFWGLKEFFFLMKCLNVQTAPWWKGSDSLAHWKVGTSFLLCPEKRECVLILFPWPFSKDAREISLVHLSYWCLATPPPLQSFTSPLMSVSSQLTKPSVTWIHSWRRKQVRNTDVPSSISALAENQPRVYPWQ